MLAVSYMLQYAAKRCCSVHTSWQEWRGYHGVVCDQAPEETLYARLLCGSLEEVVGTQSRCQRAVRGRMGRRIGFQQCCQATAVMLMLFGAEWQQKERTRQ